MKKIPEHVAIVTGDLTPAALAAPPALAAVVAAAGAAGVRCITICLEADGLGPEPAVLGQLLGALAGADPAVRVQIVDQGGRGDIARAVRKLAVQVAAGRLRPEDVELALLRETLSSSALPDPDLIILCGRDSHRQRLSDRLILETAYAELHFSPVAWSDFAVPNLAAAIADFGQRERRFGKTSAQLGDLLSPPPPSTPPPSPLPLPMNPPAPSSELAEGARRSPAVTASPARAAALPTRPADLAS